MQSSVALAEPLTTFARAASHALSGSSSLISMTTDRHPPDVPPTLTLVEDQDETAPFVSWSAASSVASLTVARFVIPVGGVSSEVLVLTWPAAPATHELPSVFWRVRAG
jgi:hypothetical protein